MSASPDHAMEKRASNHAQDELRTPGATMEECLRVGLQHVEARPVMIVGHLAAPRAEQVVQRLKFRRVGRREDQRQPRAVPVKQGRHQARFLGAMDARIVEHDHRTAAPAAGAPHQRLGQGTEGPSIPAIRVAAEGRAVAPINGGKEMALAVLPRGGDLALASTQGPASRQGRQQRQFAFVFHVQIRPRWRAQEQRLGAAFFDAYSGSRRAKWRTVHVGRRGV